MSAHPHHNVEIENEQELILLNYLWETEILPQLPPDLEEQARELGALRRKRGLNSAADLLRGLLGYVLANFSTRQLGAWAVLIGLADISSQAWAKRVQQSGPWLAWLWHELVEPAPVPAEEWPPMIKRILLVDATRGDQLGGCGDDWRLHLAYNLLAGQMAQPVVTDQSQGETLNHFTWQPGDLVVTDCGYGHRFTPLIAHQAGAEVITRIQPDKCLLEQEDGQRLDIWALLNQPPQCWDIPAYCSDGETRCPVRLIAIPLPQEQADLARKRLKERGRKKGKMPTAKQLKQAGWLLLVTTLPAEAWPAPTLSRLYRARWQIELLFKRIKQLLRMHQIKAKRPDTVQAILWALLVAWLLQDQQAASIRAQLEQVKRASETSVRVWPPLQPVSLWSVNKLCLQTLKNQVLAQWSMARFQACIPRLLRFLTSIQRNRPHQETEVRLWLQQVLAKRASQPLSAVA